MPLIEIVGPKMLSMEKKALADALIGVVSGVLEMLVPCDIPVMFLESEVFGKTRPNICVKIEIFTLLDQCFVNDLLNGIGLLMKGKFPKARVVVRCYMTPSYQTWESQ